MHAIEGDVPAALRVAVGQFSSPGRKPVNQDSMAARLPEGFEAAVKGIALAVADGISSSSSSQIAAETTVKALTADYYSTPEAWTVKTSARKVIEATNSWLYAQNRQARISDMNHGMVCTLSALILKGHEAHIFHVGDSRVSRLLGDSLEPLTEDHVAAVSATERHLVRAIGARHNVDIDYRRVALAADDIYVLSTDGVHEHIDGRVVRRALRSGGLDDAARAIAEEALGRGSTDNLTVQLLRVEALAEPALAPIDSAAKPAPGRQPGWVSTAAGYSPDPPQQAAARAGRRRQQSRPEKSRCRDRRKYRIPATLSVRGVGCAPGRLPAYHQGRGGGCAQERVLCGHAVD